MVRGDTCILETSIRENGTRWVVDRGQMRHSRNSQERKRPRGAVMLREGSVEEVRCELASKDS